MAQKPEIHNPDGLIQEQVGEGYRLLFKHELKSRKLTYAIQAWSYWGKCWTTDQPFVGSDPRFTFRVSLAEVEAI